MEGRYSTWNMNKGISLQFQQILNTLMETLIKPETLKRDLFFALLLIVIKENDFALKGNKEIDVVDCILSKRMEGGTIYEVDVVLNLFQDTPAKIIASPLSGMMLVNAIIPAINNETHSLCLDVDEYVTMNSYEMPTTICKPDELFAKFKENIIVPVMTNILNYHNQPSSSLHGLPDDLLYKILIKLPLKDIMSVSKLCTRLNKLVKEESLWSQLCRIHYSITTKDRLSSWQDTYKNKYRMKQQNRFRIPNEVVRNFAEIDQCQNHIMQSKEFACAVII